MKLLKRGFLFLALISLSSGFAFGANANISHDVDINVLEAVLIGLNDSGAISLNTVAPGTPGADPTGEFDASKELRYTSLAPSTNTRQIHASYGLTAPPSGTLLHLEASSVPANCGTAFVGGRTLTGTDQDIITSIGSCATTTTDGATLTYTLVIDDVTQLNVGDSATVNVTLTITDATF